MGTFITLEKEIIKSCGTAGRRRLKVLVRLVVQVLVTREDSKVSHNDDILTFPFSAKRSLT